MKKMIEGKIIDNSPYGYYIRPESGYNKTSFEEFANEFIGKHVKVTIEYDVSAQEAYDIVNSLLDKYEEFQSISIKCKDGSVIKSER
jgi:hypothetical protein